MPLQNGNARAAAAVEAEDQRRWPGKPPTAPGRLPSRRAGAVPVALLLLRLAALCASAAAAALAATTTHGAALRRAPFRFLLAADAIVAAYSAFEAAAAAWEVAAGATLMPEAMQLWFDFGHDQVTDAPTYKPPSQTPPSPADGRELTSEALCCACVARAQGFGYMALAAAAVAARDAASCGGGSSEWTRSAGGSGAAACARADAAVALGFAGFAFLAMAALVTGFRVACFLATGSRSAPPSTSDY